MKIACLTNDKFLWAIKPFAYLFNKYWQADQPVDIVGFNKPDFELPDNFNFISLDNVNWPANKWTNALAKYLQTIQDDHIILFLEDYWLNKPVDLIAVKSMWEYASKEPNLLRVDLTKDRYSQQFELYHEYNEIIMIRTRANSNYQMSFQVGVWNRKNLLKVLKPNETPWQAEIEGSKRLTDDMLVLGTTRYPIQYIPVLRKNKVGIQNFNKFNKEDRLRLAQLIPIHKVIA